MNRIAAIFLLFLLSCNKGDNTPDIIIPPVLPPTAPVENQILSIDSISPRLGPIGSHVVIYGKNFNPDIDSTEVRFNGIVAVISGGDTNSITAVVPPEAISGKISITLSDTTVASQQEFQVTDGVWTERAAFGGNGRGRATGFSLNGRGYILTGNSPGAIGRENDVWEYVPADDQWRKKANFPGVVRENAVAFAAGGKGYITSGYIGNGEYATDLWEYDPATDQWTEKAGFPGPPREEAVSFVVNGKGYVCFGLDLYTGSGQTVLRDVWEYDPASDTWAMKADFPGAARFAASAFAVDDRAFVGLGTDLYLPKKDFWKYDVTTDQWTSVADFPGGERGNASAFEINGRGFVGFGHADDTNFWAYDPGVNEWVEQSPFTGALRLDVVSFSINGKGYIGTGHPTFSTDFWEFTP
jgi:N-acetylneuraminic acid mutarotase